MKKILGAVLVILLVLTGCSSTEGDSEETKEPVKTEFAIGETAEIDGVKVTVNGTRILEGNAYMKPDEGKQWIAVDFTFENTKDDSVYIGGIFEITMKDGDGREKDQNIWGELEGSVDADVLSGEKLSGEKSFVISGDETHLYVYYKPSLSSSNPLKFIIK